MNDPIALAVTTIQIINSCLQTYDDFRALGPDSKNLLVIVDCLKNFEEDFSKLSTIVEPTALEKAKATLRSPMEMLHESIEVGCKVIDELASKCTLPRLLCSQRNMSQLNNAKADALEAMQLVHFVMSFLPTPGEHILYNVDAIGASIDRINKCINRYTEFYPLKDECESFRRFLSNVEGVLEDVKEELDKRNYSERSNLQRGLNLLNAAVAEGAVVLEKCSDKPMFLAGTFSKKVLEKLLGKLSKAKADIEEAMRLMQFSSVVIQELALQELFRKAIQLLKDIDLDGANSNISDAGCA